MDGLAGDQFQLGQASCLLIFDVRLGTLGIPSLQSHSLSSFREQDLDIPNLASAQRFQINFFGAI